MRFISLAAAFITALSLFGCSAPSSVFPQTDTPTHSSTAQPENTSVADNAQTSISEDEDIPQTSATEKDAASEEGLTPIYDTSDILAAYRSGDPSGLSEKDRAIYDAAIGAVSEFSTEGMSDEENVIAAHDWLVTHTTYDKSMLLPIPKQSPDTENPYGALIIHQAICMGYTTTFQLFMDMLGVESRILRGSSEGEEHAWNIVCLDGKWYHVDATWDDFVPDEEGRPAFHTYLLVTDSVMAVQHIWDRENSPKADDGSRVYDRTHGLYAADTDEAADILDKAYAEYSSYAEIMSPDTSVVAYNHVSSYWVIDLGDYAVTIYWLN